MFGFDYAAEAENDLAGLRAADRKWILDEMEIQLRHQPTQLSRNRKPLWGINPPWEHVPPVWEIRVGEYRVFYDVDEAARVVHVRAVRHKPLHRTTGEIL